MLGWVVLGKTPRSLPGSRGYNSVNYHLIYYGERGNLWHGECMRSTPCFKADISETVHAMINVSLYIYEVMYFSLPHDIAP